MYWAGKKADFFLFIRSPQTFTEYLPISPAQSTEEIKYKKNPVSILRVSGDMDYNGEYFGLG